MTPFYLARRDKVYQLGLLMLLIAVLIYIIMPILYPVSYDNFCPYSLNFILVIIYWIIIRRSNRGQKTKSLATRFVLVNIALLSCYTLNRALPVFANTPGWWAVVLIVCSANFLLLPFFAFLPRWAQHLIAVVAGIAI